MRNDANSPEEGVVTQLLPYLTLPSSPTSRGSNDDTGFVHLVAYRLLATGISAYLPGTNTTTAHPRLANPPEAERNKQG